MTAEQLLRFAFTQSSNETIVTEPAFPGDPELLATTAGERPGRADPERAARLPFGTVDLLEATPFPVHPAGCAGAVHDRLGHALVAAFGPQRREPANLYNDHRGFPSIRSKFPVHVFVTRDGRHHWLDVYRHALLDMGVPARSADAGRILLTARYSSLPALYGNVRGPLTELELGINLRALCVALDLFGVPFRVDLPDAAAESSLRELGPGPVSGWTLPLAVWSWPERRSASVRALTPGSSSGPDRLPRDPQLREAVAINRMTMLRPTDAPSSARAIPAAGARTPAPGSWAEVLFARTSGTMPRGLKGLAGRRLPRPFSDVEDAMDWLAVPPPSALLRRVMRVLTVTVCLQDIEGHANGVYRFSGGRLSQVAQDDRIGVGLEEGYGHRQAITVGCGVRTANTIWFVSVRVRRLLSEIGPWAWPLLLLTSGWITQGLCLAAAARGLYARPARAFQEIPVQRLLSLAPDEVILISVTCGTPRFSESTLDLRL
jgi:hypothetical protein